VAHPYEILSAGERVIAPARQAELDALVGWLSTNCRLAKSDDWSRSPGAEIGQERTAVMGSLRPEIPGRCCTYENQKPNVVTSFRRAIPAALFFFTI